MTDDTLAERLAAIREHLEAAPAGPYKVDERHGRDIADEGWSEIRVVGPDGSPLAATYITSIIEPDDADDVTGFLVAARTEMPLLVAAVEAVLEVAGSARAVLTGSPADCTNACFSGECDCSGEGRVVGWNISPDDLHSAITRALTGEDGTDEH